jgi:4-hydroxybenzoate polyprenyltransferase
MAFNRLADAEIDKANPRTAIRAIPAGLITKGSVWVFTLISAALLVLAAYNLNPLAFALSPVALVVIMGYSYTKRFTSLAHLWLGTSLSIAPIGAWIAIKGRFDSTPMLLGLAVLLWTAGFDIIYACQDFDFDRWHRLYSIPAKLGVRRALWISSALHVVMVAVLISVTQLTDLGTLYLVGVGIVIAILIYEHAIVKPNDLSRVNLAFFTLNGMVSLVLMALSVADMIF